MKRTMSKNVIAKKSYCRTIFKREKKNNLQHSFWHFSRMIRHFVKLLAFTNPVSVWPVCLWSWVANRKNWIFKIIFRLFSNSLQKVVKNHPLFLILYNYFTLHYDLFFRFYGSPTLPGIHLFSFWTKQRIQVDKKFKLQQVLYLSIYLFMYLCTYIYVCVERSILL